MWAGQTTAMVRRVQPAADIVGEIMDEMWSVMSGLSVGPRGPIGHVSINGNSVRNVLKNFVARKSGRKFRIPFLKLNHWKTLFTTCTLRWKMFRKICLTQRDTEFFNTISAKWSLALAAAKDRFPPLLSKCAWRRIGRERP